MTRSESVVCGPPWPSSQMSVKVVLWVSAPVDTEPEPPLKFCRKPFSPATEQSVVFAALQVSVEACPGVIVFGVA